MTSEQHGAPEAEAHAAGHDAGHHDDHADAHGGHDAGGHDAGGHDAHGHGGMDLGPVDVRMWATGLLGVVLGLVSAAVFAISTRALG